MKTLNWQAIVTIACVIGVFGLCSNSAEAVSTSTQSGRVLDINANQAERLKHQPGIHYFGYNPDRIMKNRIDQWEVVFCDDGRNRRKRVVPHVQLSPAIGKVVPDQKYHHDQQSKY